MTDVSTMTESNEEKSDRTSKISVKRDDYVDFFKGLLILWVIHIHTVFWSGTSYIPETVRQASLLIDVTAFFFISGYLTKPAGFVDAFKRSMKQFKSLYLNYLAFSLLLLPILSAAYFLRKNLVPDVPQAIVFMLSLLKLEKVGDVWGVIPLYRGSLWYLWVYFSLLFVVPFLIACFRTQKLRIIVLTSLLLCLYLSRELNWNISFLLTETTYIYFYAFVYLLGTIYKVDGQIIRTRYLKFSFLANISLCLIIFFVLDNRTLSLQAEKFPPSFKYLAYSLLLIHVFMILQRIWHYPNSKDRHKVFSFFEWCGKNSYFIYLLQGVVTSVPLYFVDFLSNRFSVIVTYFIVLTFNIFLTLLSTFLYLKVRENFLEFIKARHVNQT